MNGFLSRLSSRDGTTCYVTTALLCIAPLLVGCLALMLGQDANWDLRNYHWYNAYAFLNHRYGADILPAQIPTFYNPLLDVPFYLLATHVSARMAAFILGAVQGLNFVLLFFIARACLRLEPVMLRNGVCLVVAALGILGGGGISLIGTTFGDNLTSLGVLSAALLVIRMHPLLVKAAWLKAFELSFLFGLLPGAMMGLKLPGVIYCIGLCFAFLFTGGGYVRCVMLSFAFGLGITTGLVALDGPWAWFLQAHYGSPLFPYFNDHFKSPMLGNLNLRDSKFLPGSTSELLSFPFIFAAHPQRVGEIDWRDWRIPILYVLLPVALMMRLVLYRVAAAYDAERLAETFPVRYMLGVGVLSYMAWLGMFGIYRYAVPLEMMTPLLILCALHLWPMRNTVRLMAAGCLFVVIAASVHPGNWTRRAEWTDRFVETDVPQMDDAAGAMVLMVGIEPYSHLIPQFPADMSFVRIQSNFGNPWDDNGMSRMMRDRIAAQKGPFFMLAPVWNRDDAVRSMKVFGLEFAPSPCQQVTDWLYDANQIQLCPVRRTAKSPKSSTLRE